MVIMDDEAAEVWKEDFLSVKETVIWSIAWQSREVSPTDSIEGSMEHLEESGNISFLVL